MSDGPELDALVDKHVFGRVSYISRPENCPECGAQVPDEYFHFTNRMRSWACLSGHHLKKTSEYSTDIAAAWEVVEKLEQDGWHATVGTKVCLFNRDFINDWGPKPLKSVQAKGDTAPHAICLAALKAVGVEV